MKKTLFKLTLIFQDISLVCTIRISLEYLIVYVIFSEQKKREADITSWYKMLHVIRVFRNLY